LFVSSSGLRINEALQIKYSDLDIEQTPAIQNVENIIKNYFNEACFDSKSAIINGWLLIEESLRDLAKKKDLDLKHYEPSSKILFNLKSNNVLSKNVFNTINEARHLRNEAAHIPDFKISPDDAQNYVSMANKISSYIRSME